MFEEHNFHARAGAYIFNNKNELLLLKTPKKRWGIAGGHLHIGEGIEEGLKREVLEETGLDVVLIRIHKVFSKGNNIIMLFLAKAINYDVKISNEHEDYAWVRIKDIGNYDLTYDEIKDDAIILAEEL